MQSVTTSRSVGRASWLALPPLVLSAAMVVGMLWLGTVGCEVEEHVLTTLLAVTTGLGFGLLGALIVNFRRENRIGWICVVIGFLFTFQSITGALTECGFAGIILHPAVPFMPG